MPSGIAIVLKNGTMSSVCCGSFALYARKVTAVIAQVLAEKHSDLELAVALAGVRPEEVGEWRSSVQGPVYGGSFERSPDAQAQAAELAVERAKRAVERGAVVWLVGLNPGALEVVRNAGLDERLGRERMLFNTRVAIERYQALHSNRALGS